MEKSQKNLIINENGINTFKLSLLDFIINIYGRNFKSMKDFDDSEEAFGWFLQFEIKR